MTTEAAHLERWREGLGPTEQRRSTRGTRRPSTGSSARATTARRCCDARTSAPSPRSRAPDLGRAPRGRLRRRRRATAGRALVAGLLDAHPRLVAAPVAARFHTDDRGLPALLAGQVGLEEFVGGFRERWWSGAAGRGSRAIASRARRRAGPLPRGLLPRPSLRVPRALHVVCWCPARRARALWTRAPANLRQAQTLVRLFPGGPFRARRPRRARRRRRAGRARRAAARGGDPTLGRRVCARSTRRFAGRRTARPIRSGPIASRSSSSTSWSAGEREAPYEALLRLLDLEDDPAMRSFRDQRLRPREVGRGRWRERAAGRPPGRSGAATGRTLDELEREGNHAARTRCSRPTRSSGEGRAMSATPIGSCS